MACLLQIHIHKENEYYAKQMLFALALKTGGASKG